MPLPDPQPPRVLIDAITNLTYPSDSDEPWQAFAWPSPSTKQTPRQILDSHINRERKVVEVPEDTFFNPFRDTDDSAVYDRLHQTLRNTLQSINIFRVGDGETEVDILVFGPLPNSSIAGIKTVSIET